MNSAFVLGELGLELKTVVPALVASLADPENEVRITSAEAIKTIVESAKKEREAAKLKLVADLSLRTLIDGLQDHDRYIRDSFLDTIASLEEEGKAASAAVRKALEDNDPFVRVDAAFTLAKIDKTDTKAITVLVEILGSQGKARAGPGANAIVKHPPTPLSGPRQRGTREHAADTLGRLGARAAPAVPALIDALNDVDGDIRVAAAEALGRIGAEPAIPALVEAIGERHEAVRVAAIEALERFGPAGKAAVPALIKCLKNADESAVAAAWCLGEIGPDSRPAAPELTRLLLSRYENLSIAAAHALGGIGPSAKLAVPNLITALKEKGNSKSARRWYIRVLGVIGPDAKSAVPVLSEALTDSDAEIHDAARHALDRIQGWPDRP
jgi:HEAT repeat protein